MDKGDRIGGFCVIWFYSGTPGSGKSLHVAKDIFTKLKRGGNVIANFPVNLDEIPCGKKGLGKFMEVNLVTVSAEFLMDYAKKNHVMGKEAQTLVVLDECQIIFNPREFSRKDRLEWITFFIQHRKWGYNFILISPFDRLIDRQIRSQFEYEIKHRKINNFGIGMFIPFTTFVCITYWYGAREKMSTDFVVFRQKYAKIYDTFLFFGESVKINKDSHPVLPDGGEGVPIAKGGVDSLIDDMGFIEIEEKESTKEKIWGWVFRKLEIEI